MKSIFQKLWRRVTARTSRAAAPNDRTGGCLRLVYNRRGHPAAPALSAGWTEEEVSIPPCAVSDPKLRRRTPYGRWLRATFVVPDTNFGNLPLFFKYENETALYIRAVCVRATAFPDQKIRWGRFSDELTPPENTCRLVTGAEPVEKAGVTAYRLDGSRPTAYIRAVAAPDTIPEYTSCLTVEAEYRLDPPRRKRPAAGHRPPHAKEGSV